MNIFCYLLDPTTWLGPGKTLDLLLEHLAYTVAAVAIGAMIAIPLGILIGHTGRGSFWSSGSATARGPFRRSVCWSWWCCSGHRLRQDGRGADRPGPAGDPDRHGRGHPGCRSRGGAAARALGMTERR